MFYRLREEIGEDHLNRALAAFIRDRAAGAPEEEEKVLYLKPQHITTATQKFSLVVDAQPHEVGVDPYNKLIDRNSDDNRKQVSESR